MEVKVLSEAGYEESLRAMSLSYFKKDAPMDEWWEGQRAKAIRRSVKMAHQSGGHNDFLTLTTVYLELNLPLYMWKQLDRYQIGFRKMSESTMHTLVSTGVKEGDFEFPTQFFNMRNFNEWLKTKPNIELVANELPDGYLQRRIVRTNYMTIRNIIWQRHDHRVGSWGQFCNAMYAQLEHTEFLPRIVGYNGYEEGSA